jgi:hypothetical protein
VIPSDERAPSRLLMSNERPLSHPIFDERHELPINEEDSEGEQNFDI